MREVLLQMEEHRFCRSWGEGKQMLRNSADGRTQEQLDRIFAMLDNDEAVSSRDR